MSRGRRGVDPGSDPWCQPCDRQAWNGPWHGAVHHTLALNLSSVPYHAPAPPVHRPCTALASLTSTHRPSTRPSLYPRHRIRRHPATSRAAGFVAKGPGGCTWAKKADFKPPPVCRPPRREVTRAEAVTLGPKFSPILYQVGSCNDKLSSGWVGVWVGE